jgi:hypothetical protein
MMRPRRPRPPAGIPRAPARQSSYPGVEPYTQPDEFPAGHKGPPGPQIDPWGHASRQAPAQQPTGPYSLKSPRPLKQQTSTPNRQQPPPKPVQRQQAAPTPRSRPPKMPGGVGAEHTGAMAHPHAGGSTYDGDND